LRQASTSPIRDCTPRKSRVPVASTPFNNKPAMKSSLTAKRVQPWNVKRGMKPEAGKNMLALSMSPYRKTFSHGIRTLSNTMIESFSSSRDESG
jgi:hypothetical protein